MKVIIVAGGTGGHIYPAIAIMNKIKEKEKEVDFLYIGTTDRMEKDVIPKLGIRFEGIPMSGLNRKNIFSNFSVYKKYRAAVKRSMEIIKEYQPDIVVGAGGYITAPVLYAAHKCGIPTLIHEQNSIPGLSNKFISRFSNSICVSLPNSLELFPKDKVHYTGNPRSEEIIDAKPLSREEIGFDKAKKLVIVVMGSLGSTTMTEKIKELIPNFNNKDYQVLIITGKAYYDDYKDIPVSENVKIVPFMENLINLMKDADLIISRAGASTIAEITAIGLPAILVPSPYVTNNHQYKNAKELEDHGACVIVTEEDFSSKNIIQKIEFLLDHEDIYKNMSKCSRELGIDDSATRIYEEIKKLVG
ncbi:MAG: undecaprenyldiphospho-muramoylpentapeptide beta-N-acetylglucosaminyltransferase [Bacilli bacterium]|nr:undecaprenyldiphospho-muramoylpentapeptide beta-N-acetylglucosaminyltransferase [Bacilli bacterium]